jgi:hypothetical protein
LGPVAITIVRGGKVATMKTPAAKRMKSIATSKK